jgi:hypothetical protein
MVDDIGFSNMNATPPSATPLRALRSRRAWAKNCDKTNGWITGSRRFRWKWIPQTPAAIWLAAIRKSYLQRAEHWDRAPDFCSSSSFQIHGALHTKRVENHR